MSATDGHSSGAPQAVSLGRVDMKVEVIVLPVADADRATDFYRGLGWRQDATPPGSGIVQFTPHGSNCSIQFGANLTSAPPGSAKGYLIVSDIVAARDALAAAGIDVGELSHRGPDDDLVSGPDPERRSYSSRAEFNDPDGNVWLLQEITTRLPGRVDEAATSFSSADDLAGALRRAEAAHGEHEKRTGEADPNWPDWYASYIVAEQAGTELPE